MNACEFKDVTDKKAALKAGRVSHINLVNGPAHNESLVAQLVRAPNKYLGGHVLDSRRGLRIFSLFHARVMLNILYLFFISEIKIYHLYYLLVWI